VEKSGRWYGVYRTDVLQSNPSARAEDINDFSKNVGLLGGAMMVLIVSQPWPYSITSMVTRRKLVERG
jgi:hypothetical protein